MADGAFYQEWLDFAEMDLNAAQFLLSMRPVPIEIICFHCEQAAEKMLKSVLVFFGQEPPRTHDLVALCKMCEACDSCFEQLRDSCVELTPYGVQARYPANLELETSDMDCALKECEKLHDFVCSFIGRRQNL